MENRTISRISKLKLLSLLIVCGGFVSVLSMPVNRIKQPAGNEFSALRQTAEKDIAQNKELSVAEKQREQESKEAFKQAYRVFMSPRCMNCHPSGDVPLQGDESRLHSQGVKRGPDGKGLFALKCKNCHQDNNVPGEHMPPGHAAWHLPPANRKMVFQGKSPRQLALHFKDNNYTGFKNFAKDLIHHVEAEPLVLHSWTYGTPPPLSHKEFVLKVKEWIEKGAAIPDK
jgi:mono/diheme cytochrome c family protein